MRGPNVNSSWGTQMPGRKEVGYNMSQTRRGALKQVHDYVHMLPDYRRKLCGSHDELAYTCVVTSSIPSSEGHRCNSVLRFKGEMIPCHYRKKGIEERND
jgi:hypothetical protein